MTRARNFIKLAGIFPLIAVVVFFGKKGGAEWTQDALVKIGAPFLRLSQRMNAPLRSSLSENNGNDTEKLRMFEEEHDRLREENENFRALLGIQDKKENALIGARVLLFLKDFGGEFLLIDAGTAAGIKKGDAVIDAQRLYVGTIIEAGEKSAKVGIASNPGETHDIALVPFGMHTIAKGVGGRTLKVELVAGDVPVREGDFVTLFSPGATYPIFAAEVRNVQKEVNAAFQDVYAMLIAHPENMKEVFIIRSSGYSEVPLQESQ